MIRRSYPSLALFTRRLTGISLPQHRTDDSVAAYVFTIPIAPISTTPGGTVAGQKDFYSGPAPAVPLVLYKAALGVVPSVLPVPSGILLDTPALGIHPLALVVHPYDSHQRGTDSVP